METIQLINKSPHFLLSDIMDNRGKESKGVAVITGASAGVGRACARLFAENGYDIGLLARGQVRLETAKREVEERGQRAVYVITDVGDPDAVEAAATEVEEKLGEITVWVNNAMNSVFSQIEEMTPTDYQRVTEVTYLGQVYGTLSALRRMRPKNRGSVVFVGSALAYRGIPLQSAYCAAKHATLGFYESLRCELMNAKSNIQISMVQLPALNTTQFEFVKSNLPKKPKPMGTIFQPEVAARAILYAAENKRREVYVGFSTLKTIIGNKLVPWYADRVLAKTGIKGQQTHEPEDINRPHNLWEPVPGNQGAHGNFDKQAHEKSQQLWLSKNRLWVYLLLILLVLAVLIELWD